MSKNHRVASATAPRSRRGGPVSRLLDAVGNVAFGVTMMVLILVYAWVGSGGVPLPGGDGLFSMRFWLVRQDFGLTEMEWFAWWPFSLLLALLALSLVLVTLRRIKLNLPNLGVWTVHAGILILILGCVIYFGRKLEGDMAVYRRTAVVAVPGGEGTLVLRPNAETVVEGEKGPYRIRVASLNPDYTLLTGEDAGETTYAAQLMVEPPRGDTEPFIRQLLAGYPQFTEDVLPGRGRAVKVLGTPIVSEEIEMELAYAPNRTMHLRDRMALHVRPVGGEEWSEMPLRGLPRYREHLTDVSDVWPGTFDPDWERPIALRGRWREDRSDAARDLDVEVTGYVPFGQLASRRVPGGERFGPYVRFRVEMGGSTTERELFAGDPQASWVEVAEGLLSASFQWVESEEELERLVEPGPPEVQVTVLGANGSTKRVEIPLARAMSGTVPVDGTGYEIEGLEIYRDWRLAASGERATMILFRISGPEGEFRRAVIHPQVALTQDLDTQGQRHRGLLDNAIDVRLSGLPESGLVFVAGPVGTHTLLVSQGGEVLHYEAAPGEGVEFLEGQLRATVLEVSETSEVDVRPSLIPIRERDGKSLPVYSLVRVAVDGVVGSEDVWLRYSHYSHPSLLGFYPEVVTLSDGRQFELLYSRETHDLPTEVALEEFQLETYPGRMQERDYISLVRFREGGGWSSLQEVRSNQPTKRDGWWYFQSTWDPPRPQMGHAGLNYTGLGVGNRHGVLVMLLGSALTVLGTLYAFYVKPLVIRRIRDRARARASGRAVPIVEPAAASGALARDSVGEVGPSGEVT